MTEDGGVRPGALGAWPVPRRDDERVAPGRVRGCRRRGRRVLPCPAGAAGEDMEHGGRARLPTCRRRCLAAGERRRASGWRAAAPHLRARCRGCRTPGGHAACCLGVDVSTVLPTRRVSPCRDLSSPATREVCASRKSGRLAETESNRGRHARFSKQ